MKYTNATVFPMSLYSWVDPSAVTLKVGVVLRIQSFFLGKYSEFTPKYKTCWAYDLYLVEKLRYNNVKMVEVH